MKAKVKWMWYAGCHDLVGYVGEVVGEPSVSSLSPEHDEIRLRFEDGLEVVFAREELEFLPEGVPAAPS